ncbi:MAG: FAD-dependent oxidoreductase [Syntrophomonadaceae bacterium]|jgi:electron transfer flavoprotein-quinone oxidoreductase|nr:FAD-dependent oxidoreductase [Syntrophomonadaceae bacterium]
MAEDKFTAIVVGAGPAGSTAAYLLAREGLDVLLIEKGDTPGSKNMFGGRMYSYALNRIMPDFWEEAPLERPVAREIITLMDDEKSVSVTYRDENWLHPPYHSWVLLRADFDAWLASKAEEAGALLACNILVDDVVWDGDRIVGIQAGDDQLLADVVICADGANSLLTEKAGLRNRLLPHQVATGFKQVIELPPETINQRFQLNGSEGVAQLFAGSCTRGMQGGGFLYTNKNSISLGLVIKSSDLQHNQYYPAELLEDFKAHPTIAPLVADGREAEYSAHLVPEAGLEMAPRLFGSGILAAGDAAGFVINLGYLVRGMDLAIASGEAAARTVIQARTNNDFSAEGLSIYQQFLQETAVLTAMETYRQAPRFLDNRRLYEVYPALATGLLSRMFTVDETSPVHLMTKALNELKKNEMGLTRLIGDAWKGGRSL